MLPEEIKSLIGQTFGTTVFEIEKESVRRFADAVGDYNPLYVDAEYAGQSRYGSVIAPPGYISSQWYWGSSDKPAGKESNLKISSLMDVIRALMDAGYHQAVDGGIDYEFFIPVRAGDTITATSLVKDIAERGKGDDRAVFLFTETTYTNQNDEKVAVTQVTSIHR